MTELEKLRRDARDIFSAALLAVDPATAVHRFVQRHGETLVVADREYALPAFENIYVVGAGKASAAMAFALEEILAEKLTAGLINVKYGHVEPLKTIELIEAGHPVPDEAGLRGAQKIIRMVEQATARDLVLCLISGGGSALLPLPANGISLAEKQETTKQLLACGAAIDEINAVRKHISAVKGGQLARLVAPAKLVTLILSDVVGDPLDAIASGPTVPDSSTFADVHRILAEYSIGQTVPDSIREHVRSGWAGEKPETPKPGDTIFESTRNLIVANNSQAVVAARDKARSLGYNALILSSTMEGETRDVAGIHAALAQEVRGSGNPVPAPACLISGGETTVTLRGTGKGGRNQEFVLAAAAGIAGLDSAVIFSAGTDGTDGPTDAAGAVCDGDTIKRAQATGMQAREYLHANNAYPFFEKLNDLVLTGPTNTNVMDLRLVLLGEV